MHLQSYLLGLRIFCPEYLLTNLDIFLKISLRTVLKVFSLLKTKENNLQQNLNFVFFHHKISHSKCVSSCLFEIVLCQYIQLSSPGPVVRSPKVWKSKVKRTRLTLKLSLKISIQQVWMQPFFKSTPSLYPLLRLDIVEVLV